jgi:hypothetical protein
MQASLLSVQSFSLECFKLQIDFWFHIKSHYLEVEPLNYIYFFFLNLFSCLLGQVKAWQFKWTSLVRRESRRRYGLCKLSTERSRNMSGIHYETIKTIKGKKKCTGYKITALVYSQCGTKEITYTIHLSIIPYIILFIFLRKIVRP